MFEEKGRGVVCLRFHEKCGVNQKTFYFYNGADKSLARPGRKQATATEDFEFRISYL